jgi:hypothetical protein
MTQTSDLAAVVDVLRTHDRFLTTTHENPDGDALGSLLGMTLGLRSLGKDVQMVLGPQERVPAEYGFMQLDDLLREAPADAGERVLLCLDCASEQRLTAAGLREQAKLVVDVDHHHDNTRFGDVNLIVADASSTSEIVRDVLAALDVPLTPELAEPLYIALVTDTGRFQYSNTTPKALRLAAEHHHRALAERNEREMRREERPERVAVGVVVRRDDEAVTGAQRLDDRIHVTPGHRRLRRAARARRSGGSSGPRARSRDRRRTPVGASGGDRALFRSVLATRRRPRRAPRASSSAGPRRQKR